MEKVTSVHRHPSYKLSFSTKVSPSKETALSFAQAIHHLVHYKIYCDGSSLEGGVGAAVGLYKNDTVIKICRYHLGTPEEHTAYEAELTRIILALHLLFKIACQITRKTVIGLDNQAVIQVLNNQSTKPSHYLLDQIHTVTEKLHKKQDKLQNVTEFREEKCKGLVLTARLRGVLNLRINWVPGHKKFAPANLSKPSTHYKDKPPHTSSIHQRVNVSIMLLSLLNTSCIKQPSHSSPQKPTSGCKYPQPYKQLYALNPAWSLFNE